MENQLNLDFYFTDENQIYEKFGRDGTFVKTNLGSRDGGMPGPTNPWDGTGILRAIFGTYKEAMAYMYKLFDEEREAGVEPGGIYGMVKVNGGYSGYDILGR